MIQVGYFESLIRGINKYDFKSPHLDLPERIF